MDTQSFQDGRTYEGLVRQITACYDEISTASNRASMRETLKGHVSEAFRQLIDLNAQYTPPQGEYRRVARLAAAALDEETYLAFQREITVEMTTDLRQRLDALDATRS